MNKNEIRRYDLGPQSQARGFFEQEEQFEGPLGIVLSLINAYETAAEHAGTMARFALRNPERRDEAIWAEASASTIEWALYHFAVHNPGDGVEKLAPWEMK